jgi:hypothetical protein
VPAGKFGSLEGSCDPPQETFENALTYMRDFIKPDVIVWTGDNSPHDDLFTSKEEVAQAFIGTTSLIQNILSENTNVTFATFGNHDVYPNNMQDF